MATRYKNQNNQYNQWRAIPETVSHFVLCSPKDLSFSHSPERYQGKLHLFWKPLLESGNKIHFFSHRSSVKDTLLRLGIDLHMRENPRVVKNCEEITFYGWKCWQKSSIEEECYPEQWQTCEVRFWSKSWTVIWSWEVFCGPDIRWSW